MKVTDKNFYMDGYLKSNLDLLKEAVIKKDFDGICCVDGQERGGKSVFSQQIGYYLDNTLSLDRICFTPDEFKEQVKLAQKNQVIIYDEALTGLNVKSWATEINQALISMLAEIGQKNLFIIIVTPTSLDLEKYVILWRSRFLVNIEIKNNFERGYFKFYNFDRKKQLYILGKKFYNYNVVKANFWGRFTNFYTVNEEAYRKKKLESLMNKETKIRKHKDTSIPRDYLIKKLDLLRIKDKDKAFILDVSKAKYYMLLKDIKKDNLSSA